MSETIRSYTLPLSQEDIESLHCGEIVRLSGTVYTARDAAHKRFCELLGKGEPLPMEIEGAAVYYCGPTPTIEGDVIGSCGPTTSSRMDDYTPTLLDAGLKVMIGKGKRSQPVLDAIKQHGAVYFAAIGGAGALYGNAIKKSECIAFEDLLSEAVYRLEVDSFPAIVAFDCDGGSIY